MPPPHVGGYSPLLTSAPIGSGSRATVHGPDARPNLAVEAAHEPRFGGRRGDTAECPPSQDGGSTAHGAKAHPFVWHPSVGVSGAKPTGAGTPSARAGRYHFVPPAMLDWSDSAWAGRRYFAGSAANSSLQLLLQKA